MTVVLDGKVWSTLACCLAVSVAAPAMANDSASELAAGGLVLTRTDAIAMQREDLTLAPDEVTVRYEMRNDTGKPVTLRVAFPMPEVPVATPGGRSLLGPSGQEIAHNIDMPDVADPNFLGFFVTAGGKPLTTETEIQADLPDGRNIVKDLYRIGGWRLVLQPSFYETDPTMNQIDANDVGPTIHQALRKLRAVDGDDKAAMPLWKTRVTLHWMQTFKPGITAVEHRYRPVLGFQLVAPVGKDPGVIDPEHGIWVASGVADPAREFCIDGDKDRTMREWYRAIAGTDAHKDGYLNGATLGYVLRTARNWAGPIGTFHLTVKSGTMPHSEQHVSVGMIAVCTEFAMQETVPKQWEATVTDFVPTQDLRVMFLPSE